MDCKIVETCKIVDNTWMIKMTFSTKSTFKIVENPVIVEKFLALKQSTIARFYCTRSVAIASYSTAVMKNMCKVLSCQAVPWHIARMTASIIIRVKSVLYYIIADIYLWLNKGTISRISLSSLVLKSFW